MAFGNRPCNLRWQNLGGEGFEPSKAQGQQIYSLPRLTASVPTRAQSRCAELNRGPTPYQGVAPRLPRAWSRWPELNWRPTPYQGVALPTELHRREATGGQVPAELQRQTVKDIAIL